MCGPGVRDACLGLMFAVIGLACLGLVMLINQIAHVTIRGLS
jgi:hypothetical protein